MDMTTDYTLVSHRLMSAHEHDAPYRFCPLCGDQLQPRVLKIGEPTRPVCRMCGYVVYLDPKVAVGTIISNDRNQIALVRRADRTRLRKVGLPGRIC